MNVHWRTQMNNHTMTFHNVNAETMIQYTVNVVIFAGGKFCENVGKIFQVGVILVKN